jgi:choline dehydrogenase
MRADYVIVGAGSAGCVLAGRLTAAGRSVLLLEAGGADDRLEVRIPAAFSKMFRTDADWAYETEPQAHLGGRRLYWPRGKMLGGSSSINAMIYQRGHRRIYDRWLELGAKGWSYEEVLPYFVKMEDNPRLGGDPFHGLGGPQRVEDPRDPHPLSRAFVEAAIEAGLPRRDDFNGREQEGVGLYQVTQRRGARCSAATAYLAPARERPELTVWTHAHALGLIWQGTACTGVRVRHESKTKEVFASREVILCGGAINTPQLLMLSGVGPADALRPHDLDVVVDLPGVGRNLQDHPFTALCYVSRVPDSLASAESPANLAKYLGMRRGLLTSNVGEAGGFTTILDDAEVPDLQYHFAPGWYLEHGFVVPEGHGFSIGPTLVMPKSRGSITLKSSHPFAAPRIEPHYLSHPDDAKILIEGIRLARRIAHAPALSRWRGPEYLPGARHESDEALRAHLERTVETLYHPVGTCRMGASEDEEAVVDPELRVRGVEGLRVVDASVMPLLPNANTNAPVMMIAEKAADLVLGR